MKIIEKENYFQVDMERELDFNTATEIRKKILKAIENANKDLILNFKKLRYLDSSGINVLLYFHRYLKQKNKKLHLKNLPTSIKKILLLGQFDRIFNIN